MRVLTPVLIAICLVAVVALADESKPDPGRCAGGGTAALCTDKAFPEQGSLCMITLQDDGVPVGGIPVNVTYRPNSEVETILNVGVTDDAGQIYWVPPFAGIATLETAGEDLSPVSLTLSVRFKDPSPFGIAILIIAGMILFGGNGYSFAKTFGKS